MTSSPSPPAWAHKVSWESADVFKPANYAPLLKGADYVVQTMGILLEADYKGVISGKESPISGLQKAFSQPRSRSPNPLERKPGEEGTAEADYGPSDSKQQLTYEMMNRDAAVLVAREAAKGGAEAFAYISAAGGAPVLPARYISSKREAEDIIAREFPSMRGVFVRPPFMYDSSRKVTMPMAAMTGLGAAFNTVTGGFLGGFMGAAGVKPLKADVVAEAVVEALSDESVKGVVEVPQIEDLATKGWRKGML